MTTAATMPARTRAATAVRVAMLAWSLVVILPLPAAAQAVPAYDVLRREIEELREGQRRLEGQIEEIKKLLAGGRSAEVRNVVVAVAGSSFKGELTAMVTVVEFSDYQCPFCGRYARETFPRIDAEYISTGKVRYVFRDFPIGSLHPRAFKAHEASHCAGEQGKYWEMHDRLFFHQQAVRAADLRLHADALALHRPWFEECLDAGRHAARIRQDLEEGKRATVRGTPTFFIGLTVPDEPMITAARVIRGAQPYSAFKEAIDALLTDSTRPP